MSGPFALDAVGLTPPVQQICRYLSERSPQPMVAVEGTTHVVVYLNPAFARLVGRDRKDLIGRPFAEAVPEGTENGCLSLLDRLGPEGIVVTKHGKPVAKVLPFQQASADLIGILRERVTIRGDLTSTGARWNAGD